MILVTKKNVMAMFYSVYYLRSLNNVIIKLVTFLVTVIWANMMILLASISLYMLSRDIGSMSRPQGRIL